MQRSGAGHLQITAVELGKLSPARKTQRQHPGREHASDITGTPTRNTAGARGDATKDHDLAVPPRGAEVSAADSVQSPELALPMPARPSPRPSAAVRA